MSISAPVACGTCKKQKKRCDKRLPSCSRCLFVLRDCKYGDVSPEHIIPQYTKEGLKASLNQSNLLLRCPDIDYHLIHTTFVHYGVSELHVATVNYVVNSLPPSGGSIEGVLREYFRTVGFWLPVISRKNLYQNLMAMPSTPRADFALLLLSISLILQPPSCQSEASDPRGPLYYQTKQLFGLLQSSELLSMEMVQSVLLMALYEYGHGFFQSAFLSIGMCARMAHAMGWHRRGRSPDRLEEERRVSWGIRMIESLLDLEPGFSPTASGTSTHMEFPTENEAWDLPPGNKSCENPFPQTASLQAQAIQMLGRAISLTSTHTPNTETRKEGEDENLKSRLVRFVISVTDYSKYGWGVNCGTLGMAYSAIYRLHLSSPHHQQTPAAALDESEVAEQDHHHHHRSSLPALSSSHSPLHRTTQIMIDISSIVTTLLTTTQTQAQSPHADLSRSQPLSLHAVYQAALTHLELGAASAGEGADDVEDDGKGGEEGEGVGKGWLFFENEEWQSGFLALKGMLQITNGRWGLAGTYLVRIQAAYDAKVKWHTPHPQSHSH